MSYNLRRQKRVDYKCAFQPAIDDYKQLGTYSFNRNECKISHGEYIAGEATYPFFAPHNGRNCLWIKFYPHNNDQIYFEKRFDEITNIDGIHRYFEWIRSKYCDLEPLYRRSIKHYIDIVLSIGDIVIIPTLADIAEQRGGVFARITSVQTTSEFDRIWYILDCINMDNTLSPFRYFRTLWFPQESVKLVITKSDCVKMYDNKPELIGKHLQNYQTEIENEYLSQTNQILRTQIQTVTDISNEFCENLLGLIGRKWLVWISSTSFINQYKASCAPMTKNMFTEVMIPYLEQQYNLPKSHWKQSRKCIQSKNLELVQVQEILSIEAVQTVFDAEYKVFIAEPKFVFKENELKFMAHICDLNVETGMINGDPQKKRDRIKRKKQYKKEQRKYRKCLVESFINRETRVHPMHSNSVFLHRVFEFVLTIDGQFRLNVICNGTFHAFTNGISFTLIDC